MHRRIFLDSPDVWLSAIDPTSEILEHLGS